MIDPIIKAVYDAHREALTFTNRDETARWAKQNAPHLSKKQRRALHRYAKQQRSQMAPNVPAQLDPCTDTHSSTGSHLARPGAIVGDDEWSAPSPKRAAKEGRYIFDGERYVTMLPGDREVVTTLAEHQRIQELYTTLGENRRRIDLCRILAWSWDDVQAYLRAHRIYKTTIPVPHEAVCAAESEDDEDAIVRDVVAARYGRIVSKVEDALRRTDARDAQRWRRFERTILPLVQDALSSVQWTMASGPFPVADTERPWSLIVSPTDFHWGMRSWPHESGYLYDRAEARRRLYTTLSDLEQTLQRLGVPRQIVVPVGSDWFHVDGLGPEAATRAGTPQHVDGTPSEILRTGLDLLDDYLTRLSLIAPILAVPCRGNHDPTSAVVLHEALRMRARYDARLTLVDTYRKHVSVEVEGTLCGFTHGDKGKSGPTTPARLEDRARWLRSEARRHGYSGGRFLCVSGHVHHRRQIEHDGVLHVTCRALCSPDAWHSDAGYTHSLPGLDALVIEQGRGFTHTLFHPA